MTVKVIRYTWQLPVVSGMSGCTGGLASRSSPTSRRAVAVDVIAHKARYPVMSSTFPILQPARSVSAVNPHRGEFFADQLTP